jgi:hypothetical protein
MTTNTLSHLEHGESQKTPESAFAEPEVVVQEFIAAMGWSTNEDGRPKIPVADMPAVPVLTELANAKWHKDDLQATTHFLRTMGDMCPTLSAEQRAGLTGVFVQEAALPQRLANSHAVRFFEGNGPASEARVRELFMQLTDDVRTVAVVAQVLTPHLQATSSYKGGTFEPIDQPEGDIKFRFKPLVRM